MSVADRDVVVVGAGHNGLVAAAYLARGGMEVLVLERNERVGGAVASAEATSPGFTHDLFATNMNLFLGSPAFAELGDELAARGLSFATSPRPYASAFPGASSLRVYQDAARTREALARHNEGDAAGWDELRSLYDRFAPTLFELYGSELPSPAATGWLGRAARAHGTRGLTELAQLVMLSTRGLGDAYLRTGEAKALLAAWGMHLDFGPDVTMGALFPFLEAFTDMDNGMSVVKGGAGRLPEALARLVEDAGGEVRRSARVDRILVEDGRAAGVVLEGGERIGARRAVIANLTPRVLFGSLGPARGEDQGGGGLVAPEAVPEPVRRGLARFAYGPGTMMIHAALDGPLTWEADGAGSDGDLSQFAYVHIGPYVEDMARTYTEALNGYLPAEPLLVVGQTSAIDPTRAPEGKGVLWVQVRMLPPTIRGDAAGEIEARSWAEAREAYAERVLSKLENYAPGARERVLEWRALSPDDLEAANPNLIGGDSVAGSHQLAQNALLRPLPGWSAYRMPIPDLHLVGAGTWPGAGVNAISGRLVAMNLLEGPPGRLARARTSLRALADAARRPRV